MKQDSDLILFSQGLLSGPRRLLYRLRMVSRPNDRAERDDFRSVSGALAGYYGKNDAEASVIRFAARDKALAWRDRSTVLILAGLAVSGAIASWTAAGYTTLPPHCATLARTVVTAPPCHGTIAISGGAASISNAKNSKKGSS